jgi:hypothetical protein
MEPRRQRLSQRRKAAERSVIHPGHSEFRQDRAEVADLFCPQVAVGSFPPASRSDDAGPEDPDPVALAARSSQMPGSTQPAPAALGAGPTRSWWVKRFAVLGALAAAGVAASGWPVTVARAPAAVVTSESQTHVAVIPASDLGSSASLAGNDQPAPGATPIRDAGGSIPSPAAAMPNPHATPNANRTEKASSSKPNGSKVAPRPGHRRPSAENYLWSRAADLGEYDQRWKRFTRP